MRSHDWSVSLTWVLAIASSATTWAVTPEALPLAETRTTYYHTDVTGTVRAESTDAGTLTGTRRYEPFGLVIPDEALSAETPRFAGKLRDPVSGLDDFGARHFAAEYGRFLATDPIKFASKRFANPQDLNLYGYALNNPYRYVDPDGRASAGVGRMIRGNAIKGPGTVTAGELATITRFDETPMLVNAFEALAPRIPFLYYAAAIMLDEPVLAAKGLDIGLDSLGPACTMGMGGRGGGAGGRRRPPGEVPNALAQRIAERMRHADVLESQIDHQALRLAMLERDYLKLRVNAARDPSGAAFAVLEHMQDTIKERRTTLQQMGDELTQTQRQVVDLMEALNQMTPPSDAGPLLDWDD